MVTPYLKSLNKNGGTLYVFPSASQDLTKTFVSSDYEFKFSHFACVNIPDIYSGEFNTEGEYKKGLYLESLLSQEILDEFNKHGNSWQTADGMGKLLATHLQNYAMNFETAILNGIGDNDDYDNDILTTVSEKIFFNWLQKVGGIKFNETGDQEFYQTFSERTIPYIGDIEVVNTVEINGDTFDELYIHIPSTVGASPIVRFREGRYTDNKNYLNKNYNVGSEDSAEKLIGRSDSEHPDGLSLIPIYDIDTADGDNAGFNIYTGDNGYTIDFRDSSYTDGISTMNNESSENFEFNAILIYYDFLQKTSDPKVKKSATNLYGILILDNIIDNKIENDGTDNGTDVVKQGYIQRYPKIKESVYGNGNSFAIKVDFKVDTLPDYTSFPVKYNDSNSAYSMSLYQKAIVQLQKCIDLFYTQESDVVGLNTRIENLETMLLGMETVSSLSERVDRLTELYSDYYAVDNSTVLGLIEELSKKLNSILHGEKDVKLQYDMDVIQPGMGITMDKSLNKVVINSDQRYSVNKVYRDKTLETEITFEDSFDFSEVSETDCYISLKDGENLAVLYMFTYGESEEDNGFMTINIDDENNEWLVGQSFKILLKSSEEDELVFKNNDKIEIKIGENILTIPGVKLKDKDLIEIIRVDNEGENQYIHLIK